MRWVRCWMVVLALWVGVGELYATEHALRFHRFSVEEGLSQSHVTAIAEDQLGRLWFGTSDGLNCYDSYGFRLFHADPSDPASLGDNAISALKVGQDGRLWIGTSVGLSCYDPFEERFFNFALQKEPVQLFDLIDQGRELILATSEGLLLFDPANEQCEELLPGVQVRTLCPMAGGEELLVGTVAGAWRYSLLQRSITPVLLQLSDYDLSSIVPAGDGGYWVATHGHGLFRVDESLRTLNHYTRQTIEALGSNYIRVLKRDAAGLIWIGTYDGLTIYDPQRDHFTHYVRTAEPASISQNSIWAIHIDRQQGVWLGTYHGGVNYYHPLADRFHILRCDSGKQELEGTISCMVNDPSGEALWVGTNEDGLFRYSLTSGRFERFDERSVRTAEGVTLSDNIKAILPDERGGLWVGTHIGGLNHLDVRTRRVENYAVSADSPINNGCYSLLAGDGSKLWVGTLCGLFSFDRHTHRFSRHPAVEREPKLASRQIMVLFRDGKRRVWVGTDAGLFLCSPEGGDVRAFKGVKLQQGDSFGEPFILSVVEDRSGRIWIGTKVGLYRYDEGHGRMVGYTTRDGLPNNYIYGILEDDLHRLWLSTNNGLSCLDVAQGTFRNYHHSEGLAGSQFNYYAYCRDGVGNLYFGGHGGITRFNPLEMEDNPYAPTPHIEALVLQNGQVDSRHLEASRTRDGQLSAVSFSSRYGIFTLCYSVANPLSGGRNTFRYTLEGFDDHWYETRNREISYSNLSPGHYTFRLRAANNDGLWSDESRLEVHILPRWWQTLAARLGFAGVVLALVALLLHILNSRMKMQLQLKMERKEKQRIEELSQEKIRFYINLSHELRTPLTLILSPLQEIEEHAATDKYVRSRLKYIARNSNRLLHIVNQMIDYRKAELGMFKLKVARQEVERVVGEVFSLFEEIAQNRDMDYILNSEVQQECFPVDRMFLEMILTNLLANAFKFTPSGGMIKLSLRQVGDRLQIVVRDNGIGIPPKKQQRIFERFYQVDESRKGTGIGLSIVRRLVELHHGEISLVSQPGQFTEFTILLPTSPESYSPEEQASAEGPTPSLVDTMSLTGYLTEACDTEEPEPDCTDCAEERESLLLVVENGEMRRYLVESFRSRYRLYTATEGQQALDLLKSCEPDVILADRLLPGMDGLKLCQSVKQNIRTCHIPIILIASCESKEDQIASIEAGADDYVGQPLSITLLQAKVQNLLKSRYRLRRYYSNSREIEPEKITSNSIDGEFLKRAIEVVEQNMDNEEFSSADFAQALCMSRSNLHLKITSITGESATKFIRKIRFNHACKLLLDRKYTISEISAMVGFNSPSYFATSFKKHVGCLPTEYLRTHGIRENEKGV